MSLQPMTSVCYAANPNSVEFVKVYTLLKPEDFLKIRLKVHTGVLKSVNLNSIISSAGTLKETHPAVCECLYFKIGL